MSSKTHKIDFHSIGKEFLVYGVSGMNGGIEIKFQIPKELKGFYLIIFVKYFNLILIFYRNWNDEDAESTKRNWRWSESPEIEPMKSRDRSSYHRSSHRDDSSRDRNGKRSSSRTQRRKDRERSKSPRNKRSKSRCDRKKREKSRSRSDRTHKETSRIRSSSQYTKDKNCENKSKK